MSFEKLTEKGLARPIRVDVGGINEIAARFPKSVIDFFRVVFGRAPAQSSPKVIVPRQNSETRNPDFPKSL
jgi:hypothetical protein